MTFKYKVISIFFIFVALLFISACDSKEQGQNTHEYNFELEYLNTGITKDDNGYFHLTLDMDEWQTVYRVRGTAFKDGQHAENIKFYWESNLYWIIGDTLGYIVHQGLTDDLVYVSYDTTYITGFEGTEVPTTNITSVSNESGEVSNMIAPVNTMVGDTLILSWIYFDWVYESDTYEGKMKIVLDG